MPFIFSSLSSYQSINILGLVSSPRITFNFIHSLSSGILLDVAGLPRTNGFPKSHPFSSSLMDPFCISRRRKFSPPIPLDLPQEDTIDRITVPEEINPIATIPNILFKLIRRDKAVNANSVMLHPVKTRKLLNRRLHL